jgi:putative membrane protein
MIQDALLAYLHFIAIFVLFAFLTAEIILLRGAVDARVALLLARCDAWYGAASVAVIVTGLLRIFAGAKGAAFYSGNPVFWVKMGLFVVVGLLSIKPTITLLRWAKQARTDAGFQPAMEAQRAMRRGKMIEIHLAAFIPLAAVFMARGLSW